MQMDGQISKATSGSMVPVQSAAVSTAARPPTASARAAHRSSSTAADGVIESVSLKIQ